VPKQETGTKSISFSLVDDDFRPSVLAAINSAAKQNPLAAIRVYCTKNVERTYASRTSDVLFFDLASFYDTLDCTDPQIVTRLMRPVVLMTHGGWYIDAFDTITLRTLPEPSEFIIGEECWNGKRWCAGIVGSHPSSPLLNQWLSLMQLIPKNEWNHWTDQDICNRLLQTTSEQFSSLSTYVFNWVSESGFTGEIRLSEQQIRWCQENAWVLHYFGRGAFGVSYKQMSLSQLEEASDLCGWIPQLILNNQ
jgi:hypothetical protein